MDVPLDSDTILEIEALGTPIKLISFYLALCVIRIAGLS